MKKIDIASVAELPTTVGVQGSSRQKEVGGPFCLGVVVGVAVYTSGRPQG